MGRTPSFRRVNIDKLEDTVDLYYPDNPTPAFKNYVNDDRISQRRWYIVAISVSSLALAAVGIPLAIAATNLFRNRVLAPVSSATNAALTDFGLAA